VNNYRLINNGKRVLSRLIWILLLSWWFLPVWGQSRDITFRSLTPDNGLSQISVNDLYPDERGFIWIGTREGVNCFNGSSIQTYKLQKNNPNSLFSNNILKIDGNQNGKVYLLCTDGISELDLHKERFTTLWRSPDVTTLYYNERLYIGRKNEIYLFNEATGEVELFYTLPGKEDVISALFKDEKGRLWIGTSTNGLFRIAEDEGSKHPEHLFPKANITAIYRDADDDIWVGSWEHGLLFFKGATEMMHYRHSPSQNGISSDFVRSFCMDNAGNLWIGTFVGLDKLDKKTGEFTHYSMGNTIGMTHSSIWKIIKDRQGTLWFGTYFGGVNYFNPDYEIYRHYKVSATESRGLSSSIVGKMVEDDNDNLWICTEGGGVNVYNRKNKTFKWYRHDPHKNSISHNNVKSIYYDSENKIMWLGTHLGGLNKLDLKTGRFTHYRMTENDSTSLPSDIIRDIIPYKDQLIVATQNGVCLFFPETGKCSQLFKDSEKGRSIKMVADLFMDYYGTLWIAATGEGVFSYRFDTEELVNYRHDPSNPQGISNNNINHIAQDHYYNLWFSTSGSGLDLFSYETGGFENFDSQKNGLSSDCIYEMVESRFGKLLGITNHGFCVFDPSEKRFHNYNADNGFPLAAINENAMYLTNDGEVFLGGVNGMISFYEKDLNFTKKEYNIIPSRLMVNGKAVDIDDDTDILHTALYANPDIVLKSNYSVFSIEFTATNYIPANRDEIIYKLDGFSRDWSRTNGRNIITYTNLNPGNYTLIIKADREGEVPETRLHIEILPPFYRTWYAYLLYAIVITVILYYLVRSYNSRIKLQESLKYEQKHIRDVEALNQSKLRFFTNISHEFRTPLTLITGQMEMLMRMETFTPKIYNKLLAVYKSGLQMKELINELLDFRKQEQGHMTLKVSEHNIVDFLNENYLLFSEYANAKNIRLRFIKQTDELRVWYDAKQFQKVINNLLSNAFKYTGSGDTISVSIREESGYAVLEVEDTGSGIAAADLNNIFDRFYQSEGSSSGTGIGLALAKGIVELHHGTIRVKSEKGKGTVFIVSLPLGKDRFDPGQLSEKNNEENVIRMMESLHLPEIPEEEGPVRPDGVKMLIVEDNKVLREMLTTVFEPFYAVITAEDGEEGLEKVKSEMPDIVVSDVLMPKLSGVELCKMIKTDMEICHIPVVLLTARTAIEHTVEGFHNGADDYITKPFDVRLLISRCNNLVNSRIVLQEKFSRQPQMTPLMLATNKLDKEMIDKVVSVVNRNLTNPEFNIDRLALDLGIARTNLYAKIKAITGQTPNKFILTLRLKKAAFLLKNNPELQVSEISEMTGFTTPRYFSKCFKDVYSVNPLVYRTGENSEDSQPL